MKYTRLHNDELQVLEKDFIKFLATNSITAEDWENMKASSPARTEELIELFSDLITERVLTETKYLELIAPSHAQAIRCAQNEMILIGVYALPGSSVDFTRFSAVSELVQYSLSSNAVKIISGKKKYRRERNLEIFDEIEKGFKIVKEGALFEALKSLVK